MSISTRHELEDITLWRRTGSDGFSGSTFSGPEPLKARWQDRRELFTLANGKEEISNAHVFVSEQCDVEDYLFRGVSEASDPLLQDGAYRIKRYDTQTDLRNLEHIKKAIL